MVFLDFVRRNAGPATCFCYGFVIICAITTALAFGALEPLEYGIEFNKNMQALRPENTYQGGRRFIGLGHVFKTFPSRRLLIAYVGSAWGERGGGWSSAQGADVDGKILGPDLPQVFTYPPIPCRTKDGLMIEISAVASFNIGRFPQEELLEDGRVGKNQRESLKRFYYMFDDDQQPRRWIQVIYSIMRSTVQNAAAAFETDEFYRSRSLIGESLVTKLRKELAYIEIDLKTVDLVSIQYPNIFKDAIQETEIAKQELEEAKNEQLMRLIEAKTLTLEAEIVAQTLNYTAQKQAEADYLQKSIAADTIKVVIEKAGQGYLSAKERMQLAGAFDNDDLLKYVWLNSFADAGADMVTYESAVPSDFTDPDYDNDPE